MRARLLSLQTTASSWRWIRLVNHLEPDHYRLRMGAVTLSAGLLKLGRSALAVTASI